MGAAAANPQPLMGRRTRPSDLPAKSDAARILTSPVTDSPVDPLDGIPTKIAARALASVEIVVAFRAFRNRSGRTLGATLESFVARYNSEKEQVSAATREMYASIEAPTVQKLWRKYEKAGIAGLIPGYGKRRGDSIIARNPLMAEYVIASISHNPRVRAPWLLDGIKVRFPSDRRPSIDAVQKFIREWKRQNRSLFQRIADPDGWKNRDMLALGDMDAGITRVGQLWEIDGSPADSYVLGTVETPGGRLHLLASIDVHSRRIVTHLAPVESSDALAAMLIKTIPVLGVPDAIRHDNGAGFISARTQRGLARLGIASIATPAYRGDRKPFIERGIGTILHSFFENVPGYIGHSVVEASQIRKRHSFAQRRGERRNMRKLYRIELTAPELQDLLDKWIEHVYGNKKHSGLGGCTPNEVFAEAERRGQVRRVADDRLLDLILGEDGIAVIGKKGLRVGNAFYWADELVDFVGQTIQYVRTRDQGRLIVYSADSAPKFICIAVDLESAGLDREVIVLAGKQRQNAVMREGVEELRALKRKHRPETVYREIIENAVARAAVEISAESNVETLPYRSPALTAAAAALEALEAPSEIAPHDEEILREGDLALADIEARREIRALQLDDDELDSLWVGIRRDPRVLTLREQRFLAHYEHTPESWAINFETTDEFRAMLRRDEWMGREGQHEQEGTACARKSA